MEVYVLVCSSSKCDCSNCDTYEIVDIYEDEDEAELEWKKRENEFPHSFFILRITMIERK
jgi:hypothetical protein